jgi:hypothetical protein
MTAFSENSGVSQLSIDKLARIFSIEDHSERYTTLQKLYNKSNRYEQFLILPIICKTAIMVDKVGAAKKYANVLLNMSKEYSESWNYGNAIHDGNTVLGMVALRENNINDAKLHLLNAANTKPSPQLKSFGPSLMLADALIERNEIDAVKKYFSMMKKIWQNDDGQLDSWISTLDKGGHPYLKQQLLK